MQIDEQKDSGKRFAAVLNGELTYLTYLPSSEFGFHFETDSGHLVSVLDYHPDLDYYDYMSDDGTTWYTTIHIIGSDEVHNISLASVPDKHEVSQWSKPFRDRLMDGIGEGKVEGTDFGYGLYLLTNTTIAYAMIRKFGGYVQGAEFVLDDIFHLGPKGDKHRAAMVSVIEDVFSEITGSNAEFVEDENGIRIEFDTNPEPGDTIVVKVDGREYETVIDEEGTQRFLSGLADTLWQAGLLNMNQASLAAAEGRISTKDYQELKMQLGLSVCGFADSMDTHEDNTGHKTVIENPLWD